MNVSRSNAERLITTESAYFASAGEHDSYKALGVEEYEYLATLDSRTSDMCREMDGKIFKLSEYMSGTTAPPLHVRCRSTTAPYYGKKGTLRAARDSEGKTVYVPDMPYNDWKSIFVENRTTLNEWEKNRENQRYGRNKQTVINNTEIDSGAYRRKFDSITDNPDVNRVLYSKAKEMLKHRSGTLLEDMYWIDGDTGDVVASITDSQIPEGIDYTRSVKEAISDRTNLITMHTHPNSMPPSAPDLNSSYVHHYRLGLVICHDGRIFAYKSHEFIPEEFLLLSIANIKNFSYTENSEFDAQFQALQELKRQGKIDFWEVLSHGKEREYK